MNESTTLQRVKDAIAALRACVEKKVPAKGTFEPIYERIDSEERFNNTAYFALRVSAVKLPEKIDSRFIELLAVGYQGYAASIVLAMDVKEKLPARLDDPKLLAKAMEYLSKLDDNLQDI